MQTKTIAITGAGVILIALIAVMFMRPVDNAAGRNTPDVAAIDQTQPSQDDVSVPDVEDAAIAATPMPPRVTDRRFEADGGWLFAGTAQAGVPLAVLVDGTEVERVDIGADGTFLTIGFLGFSDAPRILTLISDPDGAALAAERTFVFDANPAPVAVATVIDDQDGADTVASTPAPIALSDDEAIDAADGTQATEETANVADVVADTDAAALPQSPAILAISQDGVEVVQPAVPADTPPEVMSNVALDTITYDPAGDVILRGRAMGEGFVQVYVDNTPVSRLPVDADGRWRGDLPDVGQGVYTLRIDEVATDGTVISRIETPFLREDPGDVVQTMADEVDNPEFTIATRTVQPGTTLWAIAEERYGSGVLYVSVFEANRDRIRNPDLIYPGQVFMLPDDGLSDTGN